MFSRYIFIALAILSCLYSCKKEQDYPALTAVNRWILDSMRTYYYWNEQLPNHPQDNTDATDFFNSILNQADRFSFIADPNAKRTEYSSFALYGFEYAFLTDQLHPAALSGVVTLVVPGGPADRQGLKRGDYFTAVNNIPLNSTNAGTIKKMLATGTSIQLTTAIVLSGMLVTDKTVQLNYTAFSENPVYVSKIISGNGKKAGYLFYNQFNGKYDQQLLQTLALFKNEQVNELILDLRYNPGGDVSTAAKFAASVSNVLAGQPFVIYQANANGGRRISSFQQTMQENNYAPQAFSDLLSYRLLSLQRIFILTTGATASAAELLINNLRPYLNVIQIGATTQGKDMASFAIADHSIPQKTGVILHPLIFKLYNASATGDYANGLLPSYPENELQHLPLLPFGNSADPLVQKALELANIKAALSGKTVDRLTYPSGFKPAETQMQARSIPLDINATDYFNVN